MRTGLRIEDLGGFLEEPRVAVMATLRADGSVRLSPVWHEWRDGGFNVWIVRGDVKDRHLRRDPRLSILVAGSEPPLKGVEVRGTARFVENAVSETAIRIATRYVGHDEAVRFAGEMAGEDVIVRLEPGELRVWDFADDYGPD
ncbi:MAG TPA: TIGR03618 family F420-dependent PPOX class oxidoreductase [Actinomycetota bacterium]|nr:TIGR03618 family F420-dependent PPOX class oxidoreductase [Actinomycetota bacterium]